ncbi:hypothetical protein SAMN04490178_10955 [Propionispora vibrioides]|uniref:Uncharacterized protein n=1 Tax=Propionispora vibrioides TaxID=112903 RepID=A0A1H8UP34_9FIRM|nr:hypothetical protein SAMN04490178_10955 [Propionispora vibrioides]
MKVNKRREDIQIVVNIINNNGPTEKTNFFDLILRLWKMFAK